MLKMLKTLPQYYYFIEKVAIHSSCGYKRECLNPWVNFAGRISVKKDTFENIFGKIWSLLWNKLEVKQPYPTYIDSRMYVNFLG